MMLSAPMLTNSHATRTVSERDPLLIRRDPLEEEESSLVSLSNNPSDSSEGSTSPQLVHARDRFKREHYGLDDSKASFCQKRGISVTFCFAFLSLILAFVLIFKDQVLTLIGFGNNKSDILFQRYEQDWTTLEYVDEKYIPSYWEYDEECDESHKFELTFAVKVQNTDKLDEELYKTSMPGSPNYGQHWTYDELTEFFAPKQESIDEIMNWLKYHDITDEEIKFVTKSKDYIRINVDCAKANRMLNTQFGFWSNLANRLNHNKNSGFSARQFAASNSGTKGHLRVRKHYSVPKIVKKHLDFISPTLRFPMKHHSGKIELISSLGDAKSYDDEEAAEDDKASYVTPDKLTDMYHLQDYLSPTNKKNHQAIGSFLKEWFSYEDFYFFETYFKVERTKVTKNPTDQPSGYGDEAELDVQYVTSTGRGIDTTVYDVEDDLYFITLAQRIADSENPPYVCSISYGGGEQANGWNYCNRANVELGKVTLMGVTFFVSSGDDGAAGALTCEDYDAYQPSFPATSPYVIAVGGTTDGKPTAANSDASTGEKAWEYSGGGFSVLFDRPDWQKDEVSTYLTDMGQNKLPTQNLYNGDGRAYPDISALSESYIVVIQQTLYSVSGTSCSAPAVAGMFSQINGIRMENGLNSLGWLNPRLYELYEEDSKHYFNDVTEGYNYGCIRDRNVGFYAGKGWDPVTGVGTPKLDRIAPKLIAN